MLISGYVFKYLYVICHISGNGVRLYFVPASLIGGALWNYFGASATFYFGGTLGLLAALGLSVVLSGSKD